MTGPGEANADPTDAGGPGSDAAALDLGGRTVVLTGATSGIGRHAALEVAGRGATVAAVGRNEAAGESLVADAADAPGEVRFHRADLAAQSAVRDLAAELSASHDRLDVLAHNAGLSAGDRRESPDGIELTLAVNHLAPYLLTHELADRLRADGGGRVVVTASALEARGDLDFEDLQYESDYDALSAYARSKLANVAFTIELAERFEAIAGGGDRGADDGEGAARPGPPAVTANCFHPGFVPGTDLWRDAKLRVRAAVRLAGLLPGLGTDAATASERLVQLIADPVFGERTGCYVSGGEIATPSAEARDSDVRERLWEESAALVGVDPDWPSA
jgi:NAD(P)-dependent dehydrogenase (short-subunit alcohol dehydrogenase family)